MAAEETRPEPLVMPAGEFAAVRTVTEACGPTIAVAAPAVTSPAPGPAKPLAASTEPTGGNDGGVSPSPVAASREALGRLVRETWVEWALKQPGRKPPEEWRPIARYEGLYEVSDLGRVRSLPRKGTRGGIRAPSPHPEDGHLSLDLWSGNRQAKRYVHQLVAEAFIGPRPLGQEVRHLDGNPANNRRDNLAYGTSGQNRLDSVSHGTHRQSAKTYCDSGHEYTPENTYLDPNGHRDCRQCRASRDLARRADQLARRRAVTAARREEERLKARDRSA